MITKRMKIFLHLAQLNSKAFFLPLSYGCRAHRRYSAHTTMNERERAKPTVGMRKEAIAHLKA